MNRAVWLPVVASLCLFSIACHDEATDDQIRVSVNSWVGFGPLYIAQEKGMFGRRGLNVDIVKLENAADRRAALVADRVDILGSTLDDLAVSLSQGIPAVAISCADFSDGGDGIIVAKGIEDLEGLEGKEIAVQQGFVNHFFLLYVLDRAGISADSIEINSMTPDDAGAAFITGEVDAAVTWEPHLSNGLARRTGSSVIVRSSEYPEAILDLFVARRDWASRTADVAAFKAAWDEAVEYLRQNPSEGAVIIGRHTGFEPDVVEEMLAGAKLLTDQECQELLLPQIEELSPVVERIWREAGYVTQDIDLTDAVMIN